MTYTEYLDLVVQLATVNLKPGSRYITAAALGVLLKQASPEVDWKFFGKEDGTPAGPDFRPSLVVVATPPDVIVPHVVAALRHHPDAVVTDV